MGAMTYLNITVRKVDRGALSSADLDRFADFIEKEVFDGGCIGKQYPHIATDRKSMYAYCEWCGSFESEILIPFAASHPEYQMELLSECNECDERERVLYQGEVMECIEEIRVFPDPEIIQWNYGE